jgi:hypothetical protein
MLYTLTFWTGMMKRQNQQNQGWQRSGTSIALMTSVRVSATFLNNNFSL